MKVLMYIIKIKRTYENIFRFMGMLFNAIINIIIFLILIGVIGIFGVWVKIFSICKYPFYKLKSRKWKTAPGYSVSHYCTGLLRLKQQIQNN